MLRIENAYHVADLEVQTEALGADHDFLSFAELMISIQLMFCVSTPNAPKTLCELPQESQAAFDAVQTL